jgi:hypothetical protein
MIDDERSRSLVRWKPFHSFADQSRSRSLNTEYKLNKQSLFALEVSLGVDVIHVPMVVPEGSDVSQMVERSANVVLEALRDSTDEWLAEFHTRRVKFDYRLRRY